MGQGKVIPLPVLASMGHGRDNLLWSCTIPSRTKCTGIGNIAGGECGNQTHYLALNSGVCLLLSHSLSLGEVAYTGEALLSCQGGWIGETTEVVQLSIFVEWVQIGDPFKNKFILKCPGIMDGLLDLSAAWVYGRVFTIMREANNRAAGVQETGAVEMEYNGTNASIRDKNNQTANDAGRARVGRMFYIKD